MEISVNPVVSTVDPMAEGDSPHGSHDHTQTEPVIRELLDSLGLSSEGLEWIESHSHSTWRTADVVVRYRIVGPTGRLTHEAAVGALLPADALYPEVVASGCWGTDDWLVTARTPGIAVVEAWPHMSETLREQATHEAAAALRAVHGSPARHLQPPCLFGGVEVVPRHAFINALVRVAQNAAKVSGSPTDLDWVLSQLEQHRPAVEDSPTVMAHGDFHFDQCLWNDGHLVGLVDLEMSHSEAPDWDLPTFLGFSSDPSGTATTLGAGLRPADFARAPRWLKDAYPELFAHPALVQRLRVYELIYRLNDLRRQPDLTAISSVLQDGGHYEHLLERIT